MNLQQFQNISKNYSAVPVHRRILADTMTPVSLFMNLRREGTHHFLLESVEGGEQVARYSFLGKDPYQVLRYKNGNVTLQTGDKLKMIETDYFTALRKMSTVYDEPDVPGLPRFTGGAVGFSGYDTVRDIENLTRQPEDDLQLPDAVWAFYDEVFAFDHVKQQVILIKTVFTSPSGSYGCGRTETIADHNLRNGRPVTPPDEEKQYQQAQQRLDQMEQVLFEQNDDRGTLNIEVENIKSNISKDHFIKNVEHIKSQIVEGETFQTVLSQRFEVPFEGDRFMLYRALRMVNPSPYLFFLEFEEVKLAGSSPEVLARLRGDRATLLPIAGTRKRGPTPEKDRALEVELKNDSKEISEHVMLVDLGRNDLSRVCRSGTVHPVKDRKIIRYSHVMHMVSKLEGRLKKDETAVDLLTNTFPAGTVSGAPKIRAMEIIDELETTKRGPYAGAVGYFDFSGNMDTCIAIRTMVISQNKVYIQAGAGIVADSDPQKEYEETKNKAAALVEALDVAMSI